MQSPAGRKAKYRLAAAAALAVLASLLLAVPALAADPAPSVVLYETYIYRNVLTTDNEGDLYAIARGQLPLYDSLPAASPEAWCAELLVTTGCTDNPPDPDEPTSLPVGKAFVSLFSGCTAESCDAGTLIDETPLRRVGDILAGVYVEPGHGVTWGDSSVYACFRSSDSVEVFSVPSEACLPVTYRPGSAADDGLTRIETKTVLEQDLVSMTKNLEAAKTLALGTYVDAERITAAGRVYALEAFSLMNAVAPGAFKAGAAQANSTPFAESTPQVQATFTANAEASGLFQGVDYLSKEYLGLEGKTLGRLLIGISSFGLLIVVGGVTQQYKAGFIAAYAPWILGVWLWIPFSWVGAVGVALITVAVAWLVDKLPG